MKALKKFLPVILASCKVMVLVNMFVTNYGLVNVLGAIALTILAIANMIILARKLFGFLAMIVNLMIALITLSFLYSLFLLILKLIV